jgi:hypothetical protein
VGNPASNVQQDRRIEYGRAVAARTRLQLAIDAITAARAEISVTIGEHHVATGALTEALQSARIAAARLDILVRFIARLP